MDELKSALLFGVTKQFKIEMGANSPGLVSFGLVWLGLVWFGWYGLSLSDEEGNFCAGEYYCHNPNSTPTTT